MQQILKKALSMMLVLTMLVPMFVLGGGTVGAAAPSNFAGWKSPVNNPKQTHSFHSAGACPSNDAAVRTAHAGGHFAVDLIGDATIKAVAPGKVIKAAWDAAYGRRVEIEHANGTISSYSHLASMSVSVGASVSTGTTIGKMGGSGYNQDNYWGVHLHFGISYYENGVKKYINPNDIFGFSGVLPTLTLKYHTWVVGSGQCKDPTPNVVTVTSTTWTATVSASWIHASPLSGVAGSTTMDIGVDANPSTSPREGYVEFKTASGLMARYTIKQSAKPATGVLPNGTYIIQNKYSGKNVDASINAAPNSRIMQYAQDGSSEQRFELRYVAAQDAYEIISHRSASYPNLWMAVSNSKAVLQTSKSYFNIIKNADGTYRIMSVANKGMALKAPSTASSVQYEFSNYVLGATSQHFTFKKV